MTAIDLDALRRGLSRDSMDDSMGSRSYQRSAIYEAARAYLDAVASDDEITAAAGSDVAFDRPGQELRQLGRADRDRYLQRARAAITAAKIKRDAHHENH